MSKTKSISQLVNDLQEEAEKNSYLSKLFNQAVKHEFSYSVEELHDIIRKYEILEKKRSADTAGL